MASAPYLAHEEEYRSLVSRFLARAMEPSDFIQQYFTLWTRDRDAQWAHLDAGGSLAAEERRLSAILDPIFTACDACDGGDSTYSISDARLREEVARLAQQRWPTETIN